MTLKITRDLIDDIHAHGEKTYPEEGVGLLLGKVDGDLREIQAILPLTNSQEDTARHNRYLITPQDLMQGDREAQCLGLEIVGVFHSHPDHPNRPSAFDLDSALPWFSYLITKIEHKKAVASRSWRLTDNRAKFNEEELEIIP